MIPLQKVVTQRLRRSTVLTGLVAASLFALPALAQDTTAPTQMKPTVVTGSYIPTAETVGPAPVQTLGEQMIQEAGTSDALLTIKKLVPGFTGSGNYLGSANNNVNIGAGFQAFTGQSYAQIRNLPTLILVDGQRVTSTALSGAQAVDLNTIPLSMIERIEVLEDGASAIYASDAIGGVINIITKKGWNGFEIGGRYGFPVDSEHEHAWQYKVYIVGGAATDTTRFTMGAEVYHQNPLLTSDRDFSSLSPAQLIAKGIAPAVAYLSPSFPGKVQSPNVYDPNNINTNGVPALVESGHSYILSGSLFAAPSGTSYTTPPVLPGRSFGPGYFIAPDGNRYASRNPIADYNDAASQAGFGTPYVPLTSGNTFGSSLLNTTKFGTTSVLEQERHQFWANLERDLFGEHMTVYSRFMYADNSAHGELAPSPMISLNLYNIAVPANNPYNPFGIALGANGFADPRIRSRFVDSGNRLFLT